MALATQPEAGGRGNALIARRGPGRVYRRTRKAVNGGQGTVDSEVKQMPGSIKVFAMNDCDWYAGASADEALKAMAETLCFEPTPEGIAAMQKEYEAGEPVELTEEDLDRLKFRDADEDGVPDPEGGLSTFRERLAEMIADEEEFPCFFASTEF